ncbi:hypothetical protein RvY_11835 [Ramazzottius varieornatus]|uniref:G-protein coupled receptors family 1 profile domain-containing protein n=1 Tax=Ramazzottius varieornatus TaxID=947166 RepID=A0A1D1VMU1_RAMVA|nr:hypothetical protein RvY_11835 [Ramazzottius varieornatus]
MERDSTSTRALYLYRMRATMLTYVFICRYNSYKKIYTKRNSLLICLTVWVLIYIVTLPNHVGWGEIHFSEAIFVCTFAHHIHSYAFFYIGVGIMMPVGVSCIAYFAIFRRVHNSNLVRNRILNRSTSSASTNSQPVSGSRRNERRKMKLKEFHRTIRMVRVLFRVFIVLAVMSMPLGMLLLIGQATHIGFVWYILAALLAHGNSSVNCLIYAWSLEHFRENCARLLRLPFRNRRSSLGRVATVERYRKATARVFPARLNELCPTSTRCANNQQKSFSTSHNGSSV